MAFDYREIDEKYFLELLYDYRSEDFKKVSRNLKTASFIIIVVWFLDFNLADLKIFGLDLGGSNDSNKLEWLGVILIIYWLVIFFSNFRRDKELQKERSYQLEREVNNYQKLLDDAKQRKKTEKESGVKHPQDDVIIQQIPKILEKYKNQQTRTKSANFWSFVVRESEFIIPLILAITALLILIC